MEEDEPIKRAIYGQTLRFHIEMNKEFVQVGDVVEFGLYDSDMQSFGNDVIKADDPIKLIDKGTSSCYSSEKINEDYKVIIEFTTSDEMLQFSGKLDQDGIYELYFRCRYQNKDNVEEIELPNLFQNYLQLGIIVIDRYKMPGLNPQGTGIAEDLAYGTGNPYKPKNIYTQEVIDKYIKEYIENGFIENWHTDFANGMLEAKEIEEVVIVGKKKQKREEIIPPPTAVIDNLRVEKLEIPAEEIIKQQEVQRAKNQKAIYTKEEIENLGSMMQFSMETDFRLWFNFRTLKSVLAWGELSPVLDAMIDKFQRNEGGVFEDDRLNENIKDADSTKRYCNYLENYIAEKLKNNFDKLEEVEDKEIDWDTDNNRKKRRKKGKEFITPLFPYNRYSENNLFEGRTLALNDIWATEVILKELQINGDDYIGKYQVILWDHFGLDKPDLEKFYYYGNGFRAWFILQHLKGYKPFLTKITFEKNKGKQGYNKEYHYSLNNEKIREFSYYKNNEIRYKREISKLFSPIHYNYVYNAKGNIFVEIKKFNNSIRIHKEYDKEGKLIKEENYDKRFKHSFEQIREI